MNKNNIYSNVFLLQTNTNQHKTCLTLTLEFFFINYQPAIDWMYVPEWRVKECNIQELRFKLED